MVVDKLTELDQIKSAFVSTVTHELRTPMTPMKSVVTMFLDGTLGEITAKQREYLLMMSRNIDRLIQRGILSKERKGMSMIVYLKGAD